VIKAGSLSMPHTGRRPRRRLLFPHSLCSLSQSIYADVPYHMPNTTLAGPSLDPSLRSSLIAPMVSQPASALDSLQPTQSLSCLNLTHRTLKSHCSLKRTTSLTGPAIPPPLVRPCQRESAHLCICSGGHWRYWCILACEHYNAAVNPPMHLYTRVSDRRSLRELS
jgi:hypothetical protein